MQDCTTKTVPDDAIITPEIRKHVEVVAAKMIGYSALLESDRKDLQQEMFAELVKAYPNFDPSRDVAYYTFGCAVIKKWRAKFFTRRIRRHEDTPAVNYDDETPNEMLDKSIAAFEVGPNNIERAALIRDVRDVIATLTPKQREFCFAVMETGSLRAACRKLGIKTKNFWNIKYLRELREEFLRKFA